MAGSRYIQWAKDRERFRYNIGRSSIRTCPLELLAPQAEDLTLAADNAWGWMPLRQALADRYGVDATQIVLASGTSMANHLVYATLVKPGSHVLVEQPCYEPLRALAHYFGAEVSHFERRRQEGYAVDPDRIAHGLRPQTSLVVLSHLHNPSGRACSTEAFQGLATLAEQHGFHVLCDEVYHEFLYGPGDLVAARFSPRFVTTCSLTKAYGLDALRAGWIVCSGELAIRISQLQDLFGILQPHPMERLALRALLRIDQLRSSVQDLLRRNRRIVEEFVRGSAALDWLAPDGGPIAFVRYRGAVEELVEYLEQHEDATLTPGRFFGDERAFRIGFGMETPELKRGLACLERALQRCQSGSAAGC